MPLPKKMPRSRSAKAAKQLKDSEKRILANRYRIEKKLGHGNFGTAWLVTDLKCKDPRDELKVLKEISVGDLQPDETVDAMHEANLLKNLDHPGIVKFFDSFMDGEFFCIVTEYCEGGDLDVRINNTRKANKLFPEALVLEWLIQLLLAVQYMHSRKVLHRDLKTRNIFLRNNMIKIGDFGISRILMGTTDMASTFTGTPYYMSPEVLKHEGYNSKSDVWSVGCILYELVTHKHAFEGQSLMGVMYKIVEGGLPEWPAKYSQNLEDVFKTIMVKDLTCRPSAGEVLKHAYIEKQMEQLKNTMMNKHFAKEQKDTINRESQQIAQAMKYNPRLEQIRKESEEAKWKNMSPRERMRLRKQMKADEEASRIQMAAQKQLEDNNKKYNQMRETMNAYNVEDPPWLKVQKQQAREKDQVDYRPYTGAIEHRPISDVSEFDDDAAEFLQTAPTELYQDRDDDDDDVISPMPNVKKFAATYASDDRPITPLRDKMVYNVDHSSLDFKDGIPDNPAVAETFYSQFEDEFDEESEGQQDHWDHDEDTVKQKPVKLPASDEDDDDDDDDDDDIVVAERPAKPKPEKKITAKPAAKAVQNFAKPNPVAIQPYVQHRRPGQPQLGRPARPIGRLMIETVEDDPDDLEDEEALEEELDELDDEEDEDAEILREATDILSNIMVNENVEQAEEVMDMLIRDVMDDDRMVLEDIEGLVVGANGEHRRMAAEAAWEEDDGIPDEPGLAETYYSQFDDEFEREGAGDGDDDDDAEGTLLATVKLAGDDEVGDLINCMQNALDTSETIKNTTVTDDTIVGAFGPGARGIKIKNLRLECEKKMGTKDFEAAYEYLKKARFGDMRGSGTIDEAKIMGDLSKLVKDPSDGFMVDQLLFLEEQARLSQA